MTDYGIYIRKFRKDNNETLLTMSKKLGVSIAFLSAMEVGKKAIPIDYAKKIKDAYHLGDKKYEELLYVINQTNKKIEIDLTVMDDLHRDVSLSFARVINTANQKTLEELRKILEGDTKNELSK